MTTVHEITWIKEEGPSPFHDQSKLGHHAVTVKGAPDLVLELCTDYQTIDDQVRPLTDEMRHSIRAANDSMTNDALRVMGFAYRIEEDMPDEFTREFAEQGLIFAGLMGMIDPARPEVKPALEKARGAGHPHDHDHRRLPQHRSGGGRNYRVAAQRRQSLHRGGAE